MQQEQELTIDDLTPGDQIAADKALVERILAGDEAAFEQLIADNFDSLYRFALSRLQRDPQLAKEIVQSTICGAIEQLDRFRGEATLFSWLCSICRHQIGSHFRRQRRRPAEVELIEETVELQAVLHSLNTGHSCPEEDLQRKEVVGLVHQALDRLPLRYGRALEWKYLEGLPVSEIATRLQIGPKAAESILSRAREGFRKAFTALGKSLATDGYRGLRIASSGRSRT